MSSGGSRPRSGPKADPKSRTSERNRRAAAKKTAAASDDEAMTVAAVIVDVTSLPAGGHTGRAPAFPLPKISRGSQQSVTDAFRKRELEIWRQVWKTPQAAAWSIDPWRWPTVAEFCRLKTAVELDPDSNAALYSRLREYRNEIGLGPDGLRMNGWAISRDQVTPRAQKKAAAKKATEKAPPQRRLRSVSGSAEG